LTIWWWLVAAVEVDLVVEALVVIEPPMELH
jgi:hypothetical protein